MLADSPVQVSLVTASALLLAFIGVFAALRRGPWLTTLLFSSAFLSLAAVEAGVLGLLNAASAGAARPWATYLAGVSALASWLWLSLSVVLARSDPWREIRNAGAYLTLALAGCVVMFAASGTTFIVRDVQSEASDAVVLLGGMGKVYLMYLVVVMVAVLMNFERMLRTAPASAQRRLRAMFVAFLCAILAELLVVSAALLYGGLRVSWLAAAAGPLFLSGVVTAFALARRRLSDMSVPLARPVIYYSSVSLTLAGAFLLTMAVLSKVLPMLSPEWKRGVSLTFYLLVGGGGVVLALSPRVNRAVKRFVDRNFYANRYDYRREWERVTSALAPASSPEDLARAVVALVSDVFDAERVALYLRDEARGDFQRVGGSAALPPVIRADNPLALEFARTRRPVSIRDLADDLDRLALAVENRELIQTLDAQLCAPLPVGEQIVGMVWLSAKRGDEDYSAEDLEFLGTVSRQVAASLWFARQSEQLASTRQLESLHRLSSFVLHDIKNQVSGLSLVLENARKHFANPEFQRDALAVVERTVTNLRDLMSQVSTVSRPPEIRREPCLVRPLLDEALQQAGLGAGGLDGIQVRVECGVQDGVPMDRRHMLRVVTNLLTNAREAMTGCGEIELAAALDGIEGEHESLVITVRDSGRGMSPEFLRQSLFRPFTSTKSGGFGVGMSQVKTIVEAHGGSIAVESRVGEGTTFRVRVPVEGAAVEAR